MQVGRHLQLEAVGQLSFRALQVRESSACRKSFGPESS